MDVEKLKQWLEMAQKFQGKDFWSDIFDQSMPEQPQANPESDSRSSASPQLPLYDILQTDHLWIILIDLPGVEKGDIQLTIAGNQIQISGRARCPYDNVAIIHSERLNGTFQRTIHLPEIISEEQAKAVFDQGVLEIKIPRNVPRGKNIHID
ncbi:HSP20 family protein [Scopulibacillus daqui]|uniref:HSP20 family protein n=1 Tax=Scopulibacillus daqui TaxID=1469162 RepID=A0ABS2Q0L3_9BACL|nr:Hsp20/alpha crystallin family protein [Scopulibacillus daqui]MBM7645728.1 HSP20 family protein [Scopulibacillus daqui]